MGSVMPGASGFVGSNTRTPRRWAFRASVRHSANSISPPTRGKHTHVDAAARVSNADSQAPSEQKRPQRERASRRRRYGPPVPPSPDPAGATPIPQQNALPLPDETDPAGPEFDYEKIAAEINKQIDPGLPDKFLEEQEEWAKDPEYAKARRKGQLLIQLASSLPEDIDKLLKKHRDELDEELLKVLQDRILAAEKIGEGDDVVNGLVLLFYRVRTEIERLNATPAQRLLDAALLLMEAGATASSDSEREGSVDSSLEDVRERLQQAFDVNRGPVDVFELTMRSMAGEPLDAPGEAEEQGGVEFVMVLDFIQEVGELVTAAKARLAQKRQRIDEFAAEIQAKMSAGELTNEEYEECCQRIDLERQQVVQTEKHRRWCLKILEVADSIRATM